MMQSTFKAAKIAIILPSRGLIFSKTAEEILDVIQDYKRFNQCKLFFSHRRPIPECFEAPTQKALKDKTITHLLFIEDDMILPPNIIWDLLDADAPVVTCDYPVTKDGQGAVLRDQLGKVVFCGTGCTLVKREVFDKLKAPYFRSDITWTVLNFGNALRLTGTKPRHQSYGNHDVTFCMKLYKAGIPITVLPIKLGQRKLLELGQSGSNDGAHKIEEWTKVKKDLQLKRVKKMPLALETKSRLVTVQTPTGEISTSKTHAEALVRQGLGTYPEKTGFILDDTEVEI